MKKEIKFFGESFFQRFSSFSRGIRTTIQGFSVNTFPKIGNKTDNVKKVKI